MAKKDFSLPKIPECGPYDTGRTRKARSSGKKHGKGFYKRKLAKAYRKASMKWPSIVPST